MWSIGFTEQTDTFSTNVKIWLISFKNEDEGGIDSIRSYSSLVINSEQVGVAVQL
jgi:hypothetical protein